jgi:hypothetical protein
MYCMEGAYEVWIPQAKYINLFKIIVEESKSNDSFLNHSMNKNHART